MVINCDLLSVDDLPTPISITEASMRFSVTFWSLENGILVLLVLISHFHGVFILTVQKRVLLCFLFFVSLTFSIIIYNRSFYLLDLHSRNDLGKMAAYSKSVLLKQYVTGQ